MSDPNEEYFWHGHEEYPMDSLNMATPTSDSFPIFLRNTDEPGSSSQSAPAATELAHLTGEALEVSELIKRRTTTLEAAWDAWSGLPPEQRPEPNLKVVGGHARKSPHYGKNGELKYFTSGKAGSDQLDFFKVTQGIPEAKLQLTRAPTGDVTGIKSVGRWEPWLYQPPGELDLESLKLSTYIRSNHTSPANAFKAWSSLPLERRPCPNGKVAAGHAKRREVRDLNPADLRHFADECKVARGDLEFTRSKSGTVNDLAAPNGWRPNSTAAQATGSREPGMAPVAQPSGPRGTGYEEAALQAPPSTSDPANAEYFAPPAPSDHLTPATASFAPLNLTGTTAGSEYSQEDYYNPALTQQTGYSNEYSIPSGPYSWPTALDLNAEYFAPPAPSDYLAPATASFAALNLTGTTVGSEYSQEGYNNLDLTQQTGYSNDYGYSTPPDQSATTYSWPTAPDPSPHPGVFVGQYAPPPSRGAQGYGYDASGSYIGPGSSSSTRPATQPPPGPAPKAKRGRS